MFGGREKVKNQLVMEFLDSLWLDDVRYWKNIIKKMNNPWSFFVFFFWWGEHFNTPRSLFSVLISNAFGVGQYYLVV